MDFHGESRPIEPSIRRSPPSFIFSSLSPVVDGDTSDSRQVSYTPLVTADDDDEPTRPDTPSRDYSRRNSGSTSHRGERSSSSSDPTSKSPKSTPVLATRNARPKEISIKRVLSGWYLEILWCITSAGCFCALCIILYQFDDHPLPKWPLGLTINPVIAFLSTVSRTGFVVPVCESISQLKWLWYRKERHLADFQAFDDASRGPWGSLKLLVVMRTKAWILALLPALVLATSLLTSTLTQSVVAYPSRFEPLPSLPNATVRRAAQYWSSSPSAHWQEYFVAKVASEIFTGLNYPIDDDLEISRPTCASSECSWPLFNTLEVCTKTWNVTKHLKYAVKDYRLVNISLPNGAFLGRDDKEPIKSLNTDFAWLSTGHGPVSYDANSSELTNTALSNFFLVYDSSRVSPSAVEVLFHLCVNRYDVSISENMVSQRLNSSSAKTVEEPVEIEGLGSNFNSTSIVSPDDEQVKFPIGGLGLSIMGSALDALLDGTYNEYGGGDSLSSPGTRFGTLLRTSTLKNPLGQGVEDPIMGVVANVSRNIAASLSKGIITTNENDGAVSRAQVKGENLGPVTFVRVRWPWLLLLGSQIVLSVVFVGVVIMRTATSGFGVMKSSLLPVLFAINSEERASIEAGTTERKYQEEFTKIVEGAPGVVGQFSTGRLRRGWVLRRPHREI
ncbi:hypothetical protein B0T10DRAFT_545972 [Thelonectria olida]|uniref:Uncharacterized protein n=1 Tax=Thelonectria olida TaxID=1576542 RepID=A0A9P8WAW5_9HYPO|nr:hypothetical protein B0T10DRAFT_545972 [Thelonectria olida]